VMAEAGLADDPRFSMMALRKQNEAALDEIITQWTSTRDRWETTRALQRVGVAAYPALSNKDLAENEHLRERGFLVALAHPEVGKRITPACRGRCRGRRRRCERRRRCAAPIPTRSSATS